MGFWSDAFSDLGDNLALVVAAGSDVVRNVNPLDDAFMSGDANNTAAVVEHQLARDQGREVDRARIEASAEGGLARIKDAATQTGGQVADVAGDVLDAGGKVAGGALDLLTNPWFLGAAALLLGAAIAAPYVAPVLARLK